MLSEITTEVFCTPGNIAVNKSSKSYANLCKSQDKKSKFWDVSLETLQTSNQIFAVAENYIISSGKNNHSRLNLWIDVVSLDEVFIFSAKCRRSWEFLTNTCFKFNRNSVLSKILELRVWNKLIRILFNIFQGVKKISTKFCCSDSEVVSVWVFIGT